jgi:hypothetical protein
MSAVVIAAQPDHVPYSNNFVHDLNHKEFRVKTDENNLDEEMYNYFQLVVTSISKGRDIPQHNFFDYLVRRDFLFTNKHKLSQDPDLHIPYVEVDTRKQMSPFFSKADTTIGTNLYSIKNAHNMDNAYNRKEYKTAMNNFSMLIDTVVVAKHILTEVERKPCVIGIFNALSTPTTSTADSKMRGLLVGVYTRFTDKSFTNAVVAAIKTNWTVFKSNVEDNSDSDTAVEKPKKRAKKSAAAPTTVTDDDEFANPLDNM